MMAPLRLLSIFCSLLGSLCAQAQSLELTLTRRLMDEWAGEKNCAAQLIVVVKSDGSVWTHAVGWADTARKIPFGDWTRIPLGELSQDLFAVGVDMATESHGLNLNAPVGDVLEPEDPVVRGLRTKTWYDLASRVYDIP